jgi:hypothetical protein
LQPTVILAVFLFFGSAFFLYLKARLGPGPYIFATVFASICIDINLTTAQFFPYPYYIVCPLLPPLIHAYAELLIQLLN